LARHRCLLCAQGCGAEVLFPEPISPLLQCYEGRPGLVRMSDNHMGFDKPANAAVIASLRNWITHEQTIQDQVTLETTKPGVYRVTGNIQ